MPAPSASAQTRLGLSATPGKNYGSFSGKTVAVATADDQNYLGLLAGRGHY